MALITPPSHLNWGLPIFLLPSGLVSNTFMNDLQDGAQNYPVFDLLIKTKFYLQH
jgi:hypothetical protein